MARPVPSGPNDPGGEGNPYLFGFLSQLVSIHFPGTGPTGATGAPPGYTWDLDYTFTFGEPLPPDTIDTGALDNVRIFFQLATLNSKGQITRAGAMQGPFNCHSTHHNVDPIGNSEQWIGPVSVEMKLPGISSSAQAALVMYVDFTGLSLVPAGMFGSFVATAHPINKGKVRGKVNVSTPPGVSVKLTLTSTLNYDPPGSGSGNFLQIPSLTDALFQNSPPQGSLGDFANGIFIGSLP